MTIAAGKASGSVNRLLPPWPRPRTDEAAALPSLPVMLSGQLKQYYGRLRRPAATIDTFRA